MKKIKLKKSDLNKTLAGLGFKEGDEITLPSRETNSNAGTNESGETNEGGESGSSTDDGSGGEGGGGNNPPHKPPFTP